MWKLLICLLVLPGLAFGQSSSGSGSFAGTKVQIDIPATPEFIEHCASEVVMINGVATYASDCPAGGRLSAETLMTNRTDPDPSKWTSTRWDGTPVTVRLRLYNAGAPITQQHLALDAWAVCRAFVPYTSETYDPIVPMPFQPEVAVRFGHDIASLATGSTMDLDMTLPPAGGCGLVNSIAAGVVFEIGFGALFANDLEGVKVTLLDMIYQITPP
jgi:hypothetical protein